MGALFSVAAREALRILGSRKQSEPAARASLLRAEGGKEEADGDDASEPAPPHPPPRPRPRLPPGGQPAPSIPAPSSYRREGSRIDEKATLKIKQPNL